MEIFRTSIFCRFFLSPVGIVIIVVLFLEFFKGLDLPRKIHDVHIMNTKTMGMKDNPQDMMRLSRRPLN